MAKMRHYLFDNPSNLFMVKYQLGEKYPNIIAVVDLEIYVLTIESKNDAFDEEINKLIEHGGGFLIKKKSF